MLVNADARVLVIDLMAYWTSHYLFRPSAPCASPTTPIV